MNRSLIIRPSWGGLIIPAAVTLGTRLRRLVVRMLLVNIMPSGWVSSIRAVGFCIRAGATVECGKLWLLHSNHQAQEIHRVQFHALTQDREASNVS